MKTGNMKGIITNYGGWDTRTPCCQGYCSEITKERERRAVVFVQLFSGIHKMNDMFCLPEHVIDKKKMYSRVYERTLPRIYG